MPWNRNTESPSDHEEPRTVGLDDHARREADDPVDWNRKFCFESATDRLADPRVVVEVTDVVDYLRKVKQPFDAIVLDVDNGPDAWCLESNERLYDRPGLIRIRRALKPAGLLAVWSARGSSVFENRLAEVGFAVRSETVRSRESKGERHTIFLGTRD